MKLAREWIAYIVVDVDTMTSQSFGEVGWKDALFATRFLQAVQPTLVLKTKLSVNFHPIKSQVYTPMRTSQAPVRLLKSKE